MDSEPYIVTRIPLDPIGFSVNAETGTIHTRYADHGKGPAGIRTRTKKGVLTLLAGKEGKACKACYPHPVFDPPAPSATPQRRVQSWREKAIESNGEVNGGEYPLLNQ